MINSVERKMEVEARLTLAELLRGELGLTGTKVGCNRAECGVCTVLMDDLPVFSCTMLAVEADGRRIETIESLSKGGTLHPIQEAFIEDDAVQCGFCIPGMIMTIKALLDCNYSPTKDEVKNAIAGNYCRCGAYPNIVKAAINATQALKAEGT